MIVALALVVGALYAVGTYLLLQRNLTRIVIGLAIMGHGANLLFLVAGGRAGRAPIVGSGAESDFADPLPQAMALTAIVITFAVSAFLMALVYRSWRLARQDEVHLDTEDVAIGTRETQPTEAPDLARPDTPPSHDQEDVGRPLAEEGSVR